MTTFKAISPIVKVLWILIALAAVFFVLPGTVLSVPAIGLDQSWTIALQVAHEKGLTFGRDLIFTYGPLGFLSTRIAAPSTKAYIIAYDIFLSLQFIILPFFIFSLAPSIVSILSVFILYFIIGNAYYFMEAATLMFLLSTFWAFYDRRRSSNFAFALALVSALICFYVKLNMGLAGLLQLTVLISLSACVREKRFRSLIQLSVILAALVVSTFLVNVDLLAYIRASMHIANGYNDAMYLTLQEPAYLKKALIILAVLGVSTLLTAITQKSPMLPLCCCGFAFLLFKQSFVRGDEHVYAFFDYISVTFGLLALHSIGRTRVFNLLALAAVSLFIIYDKKITLESFTSRYNRTSNYLDSLALDSSVVQKSSPLPAPFARIIGTDPVDLMPDNTAMLYQANLNYIPRPVIQSYTSYDSFLDSINAKFLGERGQKYIIFSHGCIDRRYCLYDDSEAKISLLENYAIAHQEGGMFLLKRRDTAAPFKRTLISQGSYSLDKEFKFKNTGTLQFVKLKIKYSLAGKILRFFYKPSPLVISIKAGGTKKDYRGIVPILNGGVIGNLEIQSPDSIKNFFEHNFEAITPVEHLRFHTKHDWAYERDFDYEVYELKQ